MKQFRSSSLLLGAFFAVLVVGVFTVDFQSNKASVLSLPNFSSENKVEVEKSENKIKTENAPRTLAAFNDEIVNIAEKAKPTVVTVSVVQTVEAPENPLARFFGDPRRGNDKYQRKGMGSGVIVSKEGYILTNNHVVENADEVEVKMYNGQSYDAKIVGKDPQTDIAVLKIDDKFVSEKNVTVLGSSENLRVGELVLAIGSPLQEDLAHSVSMGIVSAKERTIGILQEIGGYEKFIQTDAAINPGNSGGALVNMNGELVGVNSAIASRSGGNEGIGFAVPVDIAKKVMKSIINNGKVERAYLGILGQDINRPLAKALELENAQGIIVNTVREGTPASKAGLKDDDIITKLNGEKIQSYDSFRTAIATSNPGDEVSLEIKRDGETKEINVTLEELPNELTDNQQQQSQDQKNLGKTLGFQVRDLTPEIAQQLGLDSNQKGVVVTDVSQTSNAYEQGLRRGFVITEVARQKVANVKDFKRIMSKVVEQEKDVVLLRVQRGEVSQLIAFEL